VKETNRGLESTEAPAARRRRRRRRRRRGRRITDNFVVSTFG
jgi:hypothetical protein